MFSSQTRETATSSSPEEVGTVEGGDVAVEEADDAAEEGYDAAVEVCVAVAGVDVVPEEEDATGEA